MLTAILAVEDGTGVLAALGLQARQIATTSESNRTDLA